MIEPCPYCGAPTILADRRYDEEGWPYLHECPAVKNRVPNEGDFCPRCSALTWGGLCSGCFAEPKVRRAAPPPAERAAAPPVRGGIDI